MIRRTLASAAVVTVAVLFGLFATASPAAASPITATLGDGCGLVGIQYTSDGSATAYTVTRNGATAIQGVTQAGAGTWNFSVFAQNGDVIALTGGLSGSHTHVTPVGCTEPQVTVTSIVDNCQETSVVTFHNAGTEPATGFRIVQSGVTVIDSIPPGDFTYEVHATEYSTYHVSWAISVLAAVVSHTYATPGDCGTGHLDWGLVDTCTGVDWSTDNTAGGAQKIDVYKNGAVVDTKWVPVGASPAYHVDAVEGDVVALRYNPPPIWLSDDHVYHKPAGCGATLPTTGAKVGVIVGAGALLIVAGVGVFLLSRRRREPQA